MRNRKIRICYALNTFDLGGAETVAFDLARSHDPAIFEIEVVAFTEPRRATEAEMHRRMREAGVRTVSITQANYRSPVALWRIYRYLKQGHFDIVHGHNRGSDYWGVRLGRLAGVPFRFWTRHLIYGDMTARQLGRYGWAARHAAKVVAVSEPVRQACIDTEKIPEGILETIVNGIDLERFKILAAREKEDVRASLGLTSTERMVLFVGRFSEQKAPEAFIELIRRLRLEDPSVRGFMCGYGPLEGRLAGLVASCAGVEILGLRADVPDLLGACDLFVSTSRNEGLPLNVMEAMACGCAFVAPGIPQIGQLAQDNRDLRGQLFAPPPECGDVPADLLDSWVAAARATLMDEERHRCVGAAGRDVIERQFSLGAMVERYEKLFTDAIEGQGKTKD